MSGPIAQTASLLRTVAAVPTGSSALRLPIIAAPSKLRPTATVSFHTSASRSASSPASSKVNTISVDPRILDGTTGFLPKENVDRLVAWQSGLWERLAAEVNIKQKWNQSGLDMTHLLYFTARDPSLTLAFNYASALVNNSYFLESINPSDPQSMPSFVEPNAQALREKVEAYAEGIMGGGWLWLVRSGTTNTDLDILPTFGAGTLLITQRAQIGRENVPFFGTPSSSNFSQTSSSPSSASRSSSKPDQQNNAPPPLNQVTEDASSRPSRADSRNESPVPLAVLNLHEMAWLGEKYGVWDKKKYAGDWFRNLDWSRVASRAR